MVVATNRTQIPADSVFAAFRLETISDPVTDTTDEVAINETVQDQVYHHVTVTRDEVDTERADTT